MRNTKDNEFIESYKDIDIILEQFVFTKMFLNIINWVKNKNINTYMYLNLIL